MLSTTNDSTLETKIGTLTTHNGEIRISIRIDMHGNGRVDLILAEKGQRNGNTVLSLDAEEYNDLLRLISLTDRRISGMLDEGLLLRLASPLD